MGTYNEFAEPCPQWVGTADITYPSQQWCAYSWGVHTVRAGIAPGDITVFLPDLLES